jgi:hypothetical protein
VAFSRATAALSRASPPDRGRPSDKSTRTTGESRADAIAGNSHQPARRRARRHRRGSGHRRHADRHERRAEAPAFAPRRVRATVRADADFAAPLRFSEGCVGRNLKPPGPRQSRDSQRRPRSPLSRTLCQLSRRRQRTWPPRASATSNALVHSVSRDGRRSTLLTCAVSRSGRAVGATLGLVDERSAHGVFSWRSRPRRGGVDRARPAPGNSRGGCPGRPAPALPNPLGGRAREHLYARGWRA